MLNVGMGIKAITEYHDSFGIDEFGDNGNSCYKPYRDDDLVVVNQLIGEVRTAMPKGSDQHINLAKKVADDLNLHYVQYDWLCKSIARLFAGVDNVDELVKKGEMSRQIKRRMKERDLIEITALADVGL